MPRDVDPDEDPAVERHDDEDIVTRPVRGKDHSSGNLMQSIEFWFEAAAEASLLKALSLPA
jgi:hypothetical protein